uniref:Uncharacterized protein n=1 Tax=Parascaris equorum TaxID=6256 RepID=A0A914R2Y3_PAREQ
MLAHGGIAERHNERRMLARIIAFFAGGEHWTRHHLLVFLLTFFSYASLHASRKTLSTVKSSLIDKWTDNGTHGVAPLFPDAESAESFLALLDGGFLASYAFVSFIFYLDFVQSRQENVIQSSDAPESFLYLCNGTLSMRCV